MHLTNSITEILRCLDRLPKKNIQHVFLKVTKHKQPCLTAEMLGKHTWNIWSLFSKSFHRLRYWDDADFLGYKPTFMDMWWHLYNKYFYPDIFTTHIYYSILISIYIYIMYFCLPFIKSRGSRFPRRWIPLWEATSRGAAKTEEQRHHTDCVGTKHVILAIKSEKISHKKGKTQP